MTTLEDELRSYPASCPIPLTDLDTLWAITRKRHRRRRAAIAVALCLVILAIGMAVANANGHSATVHTAGLPGTPNTTGPGDAGCIAYNPLASTTTGPTPTSTPNGFTPVPTPNSKAAAQIVHRVLGVAASGGEVGCVEIKLNWSFQDHSVELIYAMTTPEAAPTQPGESKLTGLPAGYSGTQGQQPWQVSVRRQGHSRAVFANVVAFPRPGGPVTAQQAKALIDFAVTLLRSGPLQPS